MTKQPVHRNISSLTDGGAATLGTVKSAFGHLVTVYNCLSLFLDHLLLQ